MIKLVIFIVLFGQVFGADITGQGFLKTQGGDVKTCAGNEVYLEPSNKEWVSSLLLSESARSVAETAAALADSQKRLGTDTTATEEEIDKHMEQWKKNYAIHLNASNKSVLTTMCDAQGNFEFNNIKKGNYAIATRVEWKVGDEKQGGVVGDFIDINQKKQKVFLTK